MAAFIFRPPEAKIEKLQCPQNGGSGNDSRGDGADALDRIADELALADGGSVGAVCPADARVPPGSCSAGFKSEVKELKRKGQYRFPF